MAQPTRSSTPTPSISTATQSRPLPYFDSASRLHGHQESSILPRWASRASRPRCWACTTSRPSGARTARGLRASISRGSWPPTMRLRFWTMIFSLTLTWMTLRLLRRKGVGASLAVLRR